MKSNAYCALVLTLVCTACGEDNSSAGSGETNGMQSSSSNGETGTDGAQTSGNSAGSSTSGNRSTSGASSNTSGRGPTATSAGNGTSANSSGSGGSNSGPTASDSTSSGDNNATSNSATTGSGSGGTPSTSGNGASTGGASPDVGPPPDTHTETLPPGSTLPSDEECAQRIRRSSWEPRPDNDMANHTVPTNLNLASWGDGRVDELVARVTGNFTGTTDEILQWGACKWGFDVENVRAQAVIESYWHMDAMGDVNDWEECHPSFPGDASGCPHSFGILQVRWTSTDTFASATPEIAQMTALNVELTLLTRRACFEGYFEWLNDVEGTGDYAAGDEWGCIGAWFAGRWYVSDAQGYIERVQEEMDSTKSWLSAGF